METRRKRGRRRSWTRFGIRRRRPISATAAASTRIWATGTPRRAESARNLSWRRGEIAEADGGLRWRWQTQDGYDVPVTLPAQGLYNVYNALAAAAAATGLGVAPQTVANALGEHQAAFGRQEELVVDGRPVRILLGKNPSGMNSALRTLQRAGRAAPSAGAAQRRRRRRGGRVLDLGHRLGVAGAALRQPDVGRPPRRRHGAGAWNTPASRPRANRSATASPTRCGRRWTLWTMSRSTNRWSCCPPIRRCWKCANCWANSPGGRRLWEAS